MREYILPRSPREALPLTNRRHSLDHRLSSTRLVVEIFPLESASDRFEAPRGGSDFTWHVDLSSSTVPGAIWGTVPFSAAFRARLGAHLTGRSPTPRAVRDPLATRSSGGGIAAELRVTWSRTAAGRTTLQSIPTARRSWPRSERRGLRSRRRHPRAPPGRVGDPCELRVPRSSGPLPRRPHRRSPELPTASAALRAHCASCAPRLRGKRAIARRGLAYNPLDVGSTHPGRQQTHASALSFVDWAWRRSIRPRRPLLVPRPFHFVCRSSTCTSPLASGAAVVLSARRGKNPLSSPYGESVISVCTTRPHRAAASARARRARSPRPEAPSGSSSSRARFLPRPLRRLQRVARAGSTEPVRPPDNFSPPTSGVRSRRTVPTLPSARRSPATAPRARRRRPPVSAGEYGDRGVWRNV